MIYNEQLNGIKLDVQTVDLTIGEEVQDHIRKLIEKLSRFTSEINFADVHLKKEGGQSTDGKTVSIRIGIPGNDVFASVSGDDWNNLLDSIEDKLKSQLLKRKK